MTNTQDPRTVDRDGFVIGTDREPGMFGSRPGIGGLSSAVSDGERTGIIVGLDSVPNDGGLLLHVVWLPGQDGREVTDLHRSAAYEAAEQGEVDIDAVPAEGLIALDAWLPEPTTDR